MHLGGGGAVVDVVLPLFAPATVFSPVGPVKVSMRRRVPPVATPAPVELGEEDESVEPPPPPIRVTPARTEPLSIALIAVLPVQGMSSES